MTSSQSSDARRAKVRSVKNVVLMNAALQFAAKAPSRDDGEGEDVRSVRSLESSPRLRGHSWRNSLKQYWWIVLLAFVLGIGSTGYFAKQKSPTFRAKATLVIVPVDGLATTREVVDSLNTLDRRSIVATYALLPSSNTIRDRARAQLRLSEADLRPYEVRTVVVPDTNALDVTAEGPNPRFAAALAQAVADQSVFFTRDFYGIYDMKVLDWPSVPADPVGPGLLRELVAGGIFGLLVGIGAALFLGFAKSEGLFHRIGRLPGRIAARPAPDAAQDVAADEPAEEILESQEAASSD